MCVLLVLIPGVPLVASHIVFVYTCLYDISIKTLIVYLISFAAFSGLKVSLSGNPTLYLALT